MPRIDLTPTRKAPTDRSWLGLAVGVWALSVLFAAGAGLLVTNAAEAIANWQTMPAEQIALGRQ